MTEPRTAIHTAECTMAMYRGPHVCICGAAARAEAARPAATLPDLRALRDAVNNGTDSDTGDVWLHREDADRLRSALAALPPAATLPHLREALERLVQAADGLGPASFATALKNAREALAALPPAADPEDTWQQPIGDENGSRRNPSFETECDTCGTRLLVTNNYSPQGDFLDQSVQPAADQRAVTLDLVELISRIGVTHGQLVPPTGPYVLLRDLHVAYGEEQMYDRIAESARLPEEQP